MTDVTIREPSPAEIGRVVHLFSNARLPSEARLLAVARSRLVERFIAAIAWWPEGKDARFQLACQPGVDRAAVAGLLVDRVGELARLVGLATIQCANLLSDGNELLQILQDHGFYCLRTERSFEIAYDDAWKRIMRIHKMQQSRIPETWCARPIRGLSPEIALGIIRSHRLLPPTELRSYWEKKATGGFTLDLSCILFDSERPFGAFLARRFGDIYYVEVQVVQENNPILRSLGDLYMMYRMLILHDEALRAGTDIPIRCLKFRSGEIEHRQTANLALRMNGHELPPQRVMARAV